MIVRTQGGDRTRTDLPAHRVLNPARLPCSATRASEWRGSNPLPPDPQSGVQPSAPHSVDRAASVPTSRRVRPPFSLTGRSALIRITRRRQRGDRTLNPKPGTRLSTWRVYLFRHLTLSTGLPAPPYAAAPRGAGSSPVTRGTPRRIRTSGHHRVKVPHCRCATGA